MIRAQEYPEMHETCAFCGHAHHAHRNLGLTEDPTRQICQPRMGKRCPCQGFERWEVD